MSDIWNELADVLVAESEDYDRWRSEMKAWLNAQGHDIDDDNNLIICDDDGVLHHTQCRLIRSAAKPPWMDGDLYFYPKGSGNG